MQISLDEALNRAGVKIYGDNWIGAPTEREQWLLEHYVEGTGPRASIMPSMITFGGCNWAKIPIDPGLRAEVDRAVDRRDWREEQLGRVYNWLESRGFDIDAPAVDGEAIDRAIGAFGAQPRNPPAKASSVSDCQKWLVAARQSAKREFKIKAEYEVEARGRFKIGPHQFRRAWTKARELAPNPAWDKPGRRRAADIHR